MNRKIKRTEILKRKRILLKGVFEKYNIILLHLSNQEIIYDIILGIDISVGIHWLYVSYLSGKRSNLNGINIKYNIVDD